MTALQYGVKIIGYPLTELKNLSLMRCDELCLVHDGLTADEPTIFFEKLTKQEIKQLKCEAREAKEAATARKRTSPAIEDPAPLPVAKCACITLSVPSYPSSSSTSASDAVSSAFDLSAYDLDTSIISPPASVGLSTPGSTDMEIYDPSRDLAVDFGKTLFEFHTTAFEATT